MESNFIDWHPADIIAQEGNVNGGGVSQKWFEFLNAGKRIIAPMAERRDDYCESPGN